MHFEKLHEAEKIAFDEARRVPADYYATTYICTPEIQNVTLYPTGEKLFMMATEFKPIQKARQPPENGTVGLIFLED